MYGIIDYDPEVGYSFTMCKEATGSFKLCPGVFDLYHSGWSMEGDRLM